MSEILNTFLTLLESYEGPHREHLNKLWDFHQEKGDLESNLLKGFDQPGVEITANEFIEFAGQLEGEHLYTVTFPDAELPPVHGFWSLTVYNHHHLFEVNDLNRYSLGTKNKDLQFNPARSLTLYFSTQSPGEDKETNWVPAPAATFSLYLRAYWGKEPILDGSWKPPKIERVEQ